VTKLREDDKNLGIVKKKKGNLVRDRGIFPGSAKPVKSSGREREGCFSGKQVKNKGKNRAAERTQQRLRGRKDFPRRKKIKEGHMNQGKWGGSRESGWVSQR